SKINIYEEICFLRLKSEITTFLILFKKCEISTSNPDHWTIFVTPFKIMRKKMNKPRVALALGIICISIFPILVKLELAAPVLSGCYRMGIAAPILLPYTLLSAQMKIPSGTLLLLTIVCGSLFALDVAVSNIAIQQSTATQATLLTNLT